MKRIAAVYTCFNRKEKTLSSLKHLMKAFSSYNSTELDLRIYLTDDGCTDGTAEEVLKEYPTVRILKGDGNLFWAEGMRFAWKAAVEDNYDGYLLLNDDTMVYSNLFSQIFKTYLYSLDSFDKEGIVVGATEDQDLKVMTYSGSLITNKLLYKQQRLTPNGFPQQCDIGNANILYVPKSVVESIGIMAKGYAHGKGDYDYTLRATRKGIPVLIAPNYCGSCAFDHDDYYKDFVGKSLKERIEYVYSPLGLDAKSHNKFMWKFFPWRAPFVQFFVWFKIIFPRTYLSIFLNIRAS